MTEKPIRMVDRSKRRKGKRRSVFLQELDETIFFPSRITTQQFLKANTLADAQPKSSESEMYVILFLIILAAEYKDGSKVWESGDFDYLVNEEDWSVVITLVNFFRTHYLPSVESLVEKLGNQ